GTRRVDSARGTSGSLAGLALTPLAIQEYLHDRPERPSARHSARAASGKRRSPGKDPHGSTFEEGSVGRSGKTKRSTFQVRSVVACAPRPLARGEEWSSW